jgi:hypothetical protein
MAMTGKERLLAMVDDRFLKIASAVFGVVLALRFATVPAQAQTDPLPSRAGAEAAGSLLVSRAEGSHTVGRGGSTTHGELK